MKRNVQFWEAWDSHGSTRKRNDLEVAIQISKVVKGDSLITSCSEELNTVVIIIIAILMITDSSLRKVVRTKKLLSTLWAAFFMIDQATFLVVWIALLRIAETRFLMENGIAIEMITRSFWTACSLNVEAKFLSSDVMCVALVRIDV